MSKVSVLIRAITLIIIIFAALFLCILQLIRVQIVDGDKYLALTKASYTAVQSIPATRGQIADSDGTLMNSNRTVYRVILQKAFLASETQNSVIFSTLRILSDAGEAWNDNLPVTFTEPFEFTGSEDGVDTFKRKLKVNADASADNCVSALAKKYGIDNDNYTREEIRLIGGVRFEMEDKDFSYENRFVLADEVSVSTVTTIKEYGSRLAGVDISEESERDYRKSSTAPHVLGTVGLLSPEEYADLKSDGYRFNDKIGKYGIERAMESVLRGDDGERTITRDSSGNVISDKITGEVSAGSSVKLTFSSDKQERLQEMLADQINWLQNSAGRGENCKAGAVVVLDAKTGAVLGMATYPSYDIIESLEDYSAVLNADENPMYNRCINGLYRPGSAFKTITASAGLNYGLIDLNSRCICTGVYTFYPEYHPKCTGYHYGYDVINCLKWSCNIFFYDLGRRLGIERLSEYATHFGYGQNLGLEIGGEAGQISSPELFEQLRGEPWTDGNTLQAAIGQMDTLVTPLHLAVQAMTLANDGVRLKPYLVDSVWDYDMNEMLYKTQPQVVDSVSGANDTFNIVRQGMIAVSTLVMWPIYSAQWEFEYLPYNVAIKTGTAEIGDGGYNSTVMGYYPAEDPQIAFGVVLEDGEFSRYMVRNIIDLYIYDRYESDKDENGIVINPWKRWTKEQAETYINR